MNDKTQEWLEKFAIPVGDIANCYGGLFIGAYKSKRYWGVDDPLTIKWEEIPDYLYEALWKFMIDDNKVHI